MANKINENNQLCERASVACIYIGLYTCVHSIQHLVDLISFSSIEAFVVFTERHRIILIE